MIAYQPIPLIFTAEKCRYMIPLYHTFYYHFNNLASVICLTHPPPTTHHPVFLFQSFIPLCRVIVICLKPSRAPTHHLAIWLTLFCWESVICLKFGQCPYLPVCRLVYHVSGKLCLKPANALPHHPVFLFVLFAEQA